MFELNKLYNKNCVEGMKQIPDKYFELAIVDPPYFKGPNKRRYYGRAVNKLNIKRRSYGVIENWDIYIISKQELKKRAKAEMVAGIVALVFIGIFSLMMR